MVDQSGMAEVPGIPVKVADTVGAGDAFTAAWVTSRILGWNLAQQAEFANRVGALVASLPGAMPSVKEEYQRLLGS
jgi:fructokinase